jgi:hypothetical protein
METYIVETGEDMPEWLRGHARELAGQYLDDDSDIDAIVVARRKDGAVQVIPQDHLDAEVIAELLKWAAAL